MIIVTHSQQLRKFCVTNPKVSHKEVVSRGILFEKLDEKASIVEYSKYINKIRNLEQNEQPLQYQLKSLQEQINKL